MKFNSYVICLNNNMVYKGVREAERATGADHSNISKNCNGLRKSVNGLRFQYFDPEIHKTYAYYNCDPSTYSDPSKYLFYPNARVLKTQACSIYSRKI